jgi:hypothetical protein
MATAALVNVASPRNGIPIGTVRIGGQTVAVDVHPEYLRWFDSLVFRLGGTTGTTTTDLAVSSFEDAGIEENKLEVIRLSNDAGQLPPQQFHPVSDDAGQVPPAQMQQIEDGAWQLMPPPQLQQLDDYAGQLPPPLQAQQADDDVLPGIEDLRAQVAELTKAVKALQQGLTA